MSRKICYNEFGDTMKSMKKEVENLYEIKGSKFYTFLYRVDSIEEIDEHLKQKRKEYKDATHVCYAYILEELEKCSDDGEPSGTAGIPLLTILKQKELNHILCIVVRYFGGIKLGAGGLTRAYRTSLTSTFEKAFIISLSPGYQIQITFPYEKKKEVDFLLKEKNISYMEYAEDVLYELEILKEEYEKLKEMGKHIFKTLLIQKEIYTEKK